MRRAATFLAGLLLFGLPLRAELCQLTRRPIALWPPGEPLPPQGKFTNFALPAFSYAGGKYFVGGEVKAEAGPYRSKKVLLVSDDLQRFRRVPWPEGPILAPAEAWYSHGWFFGAAVFGGLVVSPDGEHWSEPVAPSFDSFCWDGVKYVGEHFLRGIWVSSDGLHWQYMGELPATDFHTSAISDGKRFVSFAACHYCRSSWSDRPMVTEDFVNWTLEDPPIADGWFPWLFAVGNGYYLAGLDGYGAFARSRDGLTYENVGFPGAIPPPLENGDFFLGVVGSRTYLTGTKLWKVEADKENRYDPFSQYSHFFWTSFDLRNDSWQVGPIMYQIQTYPLVDDKGQYSLEHSWEGVWDGKAAHFLLGRLRIEEGGYSLSDFELLSFSCPQFGEPQVFPGVAHGEGALGTFWKSSLTLTYAGQQEAEVLLEWLPYGAPNPSPKSRRVWLNTGQTVEWQDVVQELFGASGNGALRLTIVSGSGVVASVRTYNQGASGTYGQLVPGWTWEEGIGPGEDGWLVGLADSGGAGGFRTNVGVQNLWVGEVEVEVRFFAADGKELGKLTKVLGPFEGVQWHRPLQQLVPSGVEKVSAVVRIIRGNDSRVACYASKVDNLTGDGTTIKGAKLPYQGRPFENPCPQGCPPLEH